MNLFYCPLSSSFWGFVFEMFINSWKSVCFQTLNAFICWPLSPCVVGWARAELYWWSVLIFMWWTKCLEGPYGRRSVGDPAKFLSFFCVIEDVLVMLMSCMELWRVNCVMCRCSWKWLLETHFFSLELFFFIFLCLLLND